MLPTEKAGYLALLLQSNTLLEDSETGIIQLSPDAYDLLGKSTPNVFNQKAHRERIEKLVKDYLSLWPAKIMSGNRLIKQGPGAIRKKLTTFLRKYPKYTDEEILAATQQYIKKLRQSNFQYMISSDYFIEKDGVSQLEAYIIAMESQKIIGNANKVLQSIHERTL
jgi:hypothetical protein